MSRWHDRLRNLFIAGSCASLLACGCSQSGKSDAPKVEEKGAEAPAENVQTPHTVNSSPAGAARVNYAQTFEEAIITEVLDGQHFPPNETIGGKKTGALRAAVETLWPRIRLTDGSGNPRSFVVTLNTAEGPIEIQLQPEIAPNHVRNFLALVHLGYYDGLCFERIVHQEAETDAGKSRLDLIMAGCPAGTGEEGLGHIGYFVRSEFQSDLKHSEGTVGFYHEEEPDSAGTRFYITLGPAPVFDGKFTVIGKVIKGLDTARKVADAPVQSNDTYPEKEKPLKPVTIQKATAALDFMEK